jgi:hypothetical protein
MVRRTKQGDIGESQLRDEEEMVWANTESPCRKSERRAGSRERRGRGKVAL